MKEVYTSGSWDIPWYTMRNRCITILYHATENSVASKASIIKTQTTDERNWQESQCTMERLGIILLNCTDWWEGLVEFWQIYNHFPAFWLAVFSLTICYFSIFLWRKIVSKQMQIKWISHLLVCHFLELELLEGQTKALHLPLWWKKHFCSKLPPQVHTASNIILLQ